MALIGSHLCLFLYMSLRPHNQDLFKYPSLEAGRTPMPRPFAHPHKAWFPGRVREVLLHVSHVPRRSALTQPTSQPTGPFGSGSSIVLGPDLGQRVLGGPHCPALSQGVQACAAWKILDFRFLPNLAALQGTFLSPANSRTLMQSHR